MKFSDSATHGQAAFLANAPDADTPIILVGMMGAGKTTIGRQLASLLDREFIDLDHVIEERCGVSIATIFDIEGETGFRQRETAVLNEYTRPGAVVLATGGGAILARENRCMLQNRGYVVYLRATAAELYRRLGRDRNRPLLQTPDPLATLQKLLAQREPLYASVASITHDTGRQPVNQVAQELFHRLQKYRTESQGMQTITVNTAAGAYPIHIGDGRLNHLDGSIPGDATAIALVSNPVVAELYGDRARSALARTGLPVHEIVLPDGEQHKNWASLDIIFDRLLAQAFDRQGVLVALGGGVLGDICGFAAACYMRGLRYVQVPTTLLAQVDSSVGGKTAINHPRGKNMIGAFYQPVAVEIDLSVLGSLPPREISAGLAEVIKYGLIADADFFAWCEANVAQLRALDHDAILYAVRRSCELKAWVVGEDEREAGLRAILNFGHTFGHAIEAGLGYGQWLHGEAIACGMILAAELSARVCGLDRSVVQRVRALVEGIGCPLQAPDLGIERWLQLMRVDKKARDQQIRYVLLPQLGQAKIMPVADELVSELLTCSS